MSLEALRDAVRLIPVARLLRRAEPPSREAELVTLRARFRAQPEPRNASGAAVDSAKRLMALRVEMSAAFAGADACRSCAKGRPEPHGHWPGGSCCGSRTLNLFTRTEVTALKLAGVRAADLRPPRGDHAGCAFRAERGCVLPPEQRPSICVRYVCIDLRAELRDKPEWQRISTLGAALRDESSRFEALVSHP